jgi:hypothetical protein
MSLLGVGRSSCARRTDLQQLAGRVPAEAGTAWEEVAVVAVVAVMRVVGATGPRAAGTGHCTVVSERSGRYVPLVAAFGDRR